MCIKVFRRWAIGIILKKPMSNHFQIDGQLPNDPTIVGQLLLVLFTRNIKQSNLQNYYLEKK
jgi:hypothetical protein